MSPPEMKLWIPSLEGKGAETGLLRERMGGGGVWRVEEVRCRAPGREASGCRAGGKGTHEGQA